jgi:hypothetical protein
MRRLGLSLTLVVGVYAAIELVAFVLFWIADGEPFSFSRLRAQREAVASGAVPGASAAAAGDLVPVSLAHRALHPYVGFVDAPGADRPGAVRRRRPVRNRFGWPREQDPLLRRAPDRLVVAILGGSVAGGFAGHGAQVLERTLRALPRFAQRRFVFVPIALAGYKQPQQLLAVTWLLSLGGQFDLVVNLDGFNEVALHPAENARTDTFASYPRQWHYLLAELPERPLDELSYERVRRTRLAERHSWPLVRRSVLANLVWRLRDRLALARVRNVETSLASQGAGATRYAQRGPARQYASRDEMMRDLVSIWRESSLQLHRLCRANGIEYFHFLQPNQYVPPGSLPTWRRLSTSTSAAISTGWDTGSSPRPWPTPSRRADRHPLRLRGFPAGQTRCGLTLSRGRVRIER